MYVNLKYLKYSYIYIRFLKSSYIYCEKYLQQDFVFGGNLWINIVIFGEGRIKRKELINYWRKWQLVGRKIKLKNLSICGFLRMN